MHAHPAGVAGRLLPPSTLAQIDRLELLARTAVNGFMSGMHRSSQAGSSTARKAMSTAAFMSAPGAE